MMENRENMNGDNVEVIDVATKSKQIVKNGKNQLSIYHLFCIAFVAFWFGVVFASITLSTRVIQSTCTPPGCTDDADVVVAKTKSTSDPNQLITRPVHPSNENEHLDEKKIILLYGNKVWTKYDKWHRYDWRKCPAEYSNCRITTDPTRLSQSAAVVYNAADMPTRVHIDSTRGRNFKRVFLSGLTPLRTKFEPSDFKSFFDLTITYKSDSNIRIPYWPNDGLLPDMYRPAPEEDKKKLSEDDLLDLQDESKDYFLKAGKDPFMGAMVTNCEDNYYPNLYMRKLQEEGMIHAFTANNSQDCLKRMKDTVVLPCKGELSDDCVKHFETFKYILVPDDDLCLDYTTRKYWTAIFAWQAVPLVYGAGNYKKHLIPNSYIDCVGNEDYISPSFKKAWYPSQDAFTYYKTYHLWRHENRVEKFHWQCELCRELHSKSASSSKVDMTQFWDKDKDCGEKIKVHELMRLQLVRTGVIR